ncbi:hypothetical protein [Streptomyces sp. RFCAC02]|uniref:hypothetical protein n=1 Tax=Streptomyces sp. RFCAC02 TaxID=2499143 RepID=UPI00143D6BFC|nr:hypothetical protein [Streptomyces sp. RFCAC02]
MSGTEETNEPEYLDSAGDDEEERQLTLDELRALAIEMSETIRLHLESLDSGHH